jgi:excisionase family DNA binding protein
MAISCGMGLAGATRGIQNDIVPIPNRRSAMDMQAVSRLGLTVDDFAQATTLHPQTVRQLLKEGRIRSVRVGRRHVIPRTELERFLSVQAAAP